MSKANVKKSNAKAPVKKMGTSEVVKSSVRMISLVELIENERSGFDLTQKSQLASGFVAYRKILQGPENLPLAVGVRVLDYCVSSSNKELFFEFYSLLHTYYYHLFGNSQGVLDLMKKVSEVLYSNVETRVKMQEVERIYENNQKVLELAIRNLVSIVSKLNYYRKSCTEGLELRSLDALSQAVQSDWLELADFVLFLNKFDIQLKVVSFLTNQPTTYGTKPSNIIYLLKVQNGEYNTLYTAEEHFKQSATEQERMEIRTVFSKIRQVGSELPTEEVRQIKARTQEFNKKTEDNFSVLKIIDSALGLQCDLSSLKTIISTPEVDSVLEKHCCNKCSKLQKSAEFPCGHVLCYSCSYLNYDQDFRFCSLCSFKTYKDAVDKYFI